MILMAQATYKHVTENGEDCIEVETVWHSDGKLDRRDGLGYRLGPNHDRLAKRLVRAINDGKVFVDMSVKRDVNGKTYVEETSLVRGRTMNADLKRLGY